MHCNYNCSYCSVYSVFNTPVRFNEFQTIPARAWLEALNNPKIYDLFELNYGIIISGGEPTLYKEFKELCDGLDNRNICVYSNISQVAYNKLCSLEKPVKIYPSYHAKMEESFRGWYRRLMDLRLCGHQVYAVHSPNDASEQVKETSSWVLKTRIEGIWNGEFYSPYVNDCRVRSTELRTVKCFTQHFTAAPNGDIYNCMGNMLTMREGTVVANIQDVNWAEFPVMVDCAHCGNCHPCSMLKIIKEPDGKMITDEWQYKPILEQMPKRKVA